MVVCSEFLSCLLGDADQVVNTVACKIPMLTVILVSLMSPLCSGSGRGRAGFPISVAVSPHPGDAEVCTSPQEEDILLPCNPLGLTGRKMKKGFRGDGG